MCESPRAMYPEAFRRLRASASSSPQRGDLPPSSSGGTTGNPTDALTPLRPYGEAVREVIIHVRQAAGQRRTHHGEKGKLFSPTTTAPVLRGDEGGETEYVGGRPERCLQGCAAEHPRSPGQMQEWFRMMKEGVPAYSNFRRCGLSD